MHLSRRDLIKSASVLTAAVSAIEFGRTSPAWAEDKFTVASTGRFGRSQLDWHRESRTTLTLLKILDKQPS